MFDFTDVERLARQLQQEANELLDGGLRSLLEQYGRVEPTGSFVLGLMTWRDLDLQLVRADVDHEAFFSLGANLCGLLKPYKMSYRDELIAQTPNLPRGLYWGIYLGDERAGAWKIDIWAIDEKQFEASRNDLDLLAKQIDSARRLAILRIKGAVWQHSEYRKTITSRDIYEAVFTSEVRNLEGFTDWLQERGITI